MALMEVNFFSDTLGMCMSMNCVIPQGADKYPVLWLLHGMSDDHTIWSRRTSIERYADEHGVAVVMPTTYLGWYTDMKFGYRYRTFIGEELPLICRSFFPGMSGRREDNYISGNSMGGYGSLALAMTYPDNYSVCAPLSAAFDPKILYRPDSTYFTDIFGDIGDFDGSVGDMYHMTSLRAKDGSRLPKIYIACGTEDSLIGENRKMKEHLGSLGYDVTYRERSGSHNWGFWDEEIQSVLNLIDGFRKEL